MTAALKSSDADPCVQAGEEPPDADPCVKAGGPLLPLRGKAGRSFSGEPKRSAVAAVAGDYQFINMSVNTLSVHDKIRPRPI